jgi:hypothetical protein
MEQFASDPLVGDMALGMFLAEEATLVEKPEKTESLGVLFWVCVGWITLNVLAAILANVLPLKNPYFEDFNNINVGPGLRHLGTDDLGRDIFSRVVFGSRVSIAVGVGAMIIGFGIGAPLGMLAAYRRGRLDTFITTIMYVLLAFPAIIATIAVLSFWTPRSLVKIIIVIGLASSTASFVRPPSASRPRTTSSRRRSRAPPTGGSSSRSCCPTSRPSGSRSCSLASRPSSRSRAPSPSSASRSTRRRRRGAT